jgi:WD40 repeat protein
MIQHDDATTAPDEGLTPLDRWLDEPTRPSGSFFLLTRVEARRGVSGHALAEWCARMRDEGDRVVLLTVLRGEPPEAVVARLASAIEAEIPGFEDRMAPPERRLPELLGRLAKRHLAPPSRRLLLVIDGLERLRARDEADNPLARLLPHTPPRGVFLIAGLAEGSAWARWSVGPARVASAPLLVRAAGDGPLCEDDVSFGSDVSAVDAALAALDRRRQGGGSWAEIWAGALGLVRSPAAGLREAWVRAALAEACAAAPTASEADRARDLLCAWSAAAPAIVHEPAAQRALLYDRLLDRGWAPGAIAAALDAGEGRPRLARWLPLPNRDRALRVLFGHGSKVMSVGLSEDGETLASGGEDGAVLLWSLRRERVTRALCGHTGAVTSLRFLPRQEGRLASAGEDGRVLLWDLAAGAVVSTLAGHEGGVEAIAVTGDETGLLAATEGGALVLWDLRTGARRWTAAASEVGLTSCALSEDGLLALSGSHDKAVKVWSMIDGSLVRVMDGAPMYSVSGVATAGGVVVASAYDNSLRVGSLADGAALAVLDGHGSWVTGVSLETGGRRALSCSRDKTLRLWRIDGAGGEGEARGGEETCLWGHRAMVNACAIARGGRLAASGAADSSVRLWRLPAAGEGVAPRLGHEGAIRACVFKGSGAVLTASEDSTARLWSTTSGEELRRFAAHLHGVTSLALSGDGSRLITGSLDRSIRVWEIEDAEAEPRALYGHAHGVSALALRGDGALLASGSIDGSMKVWRLSSKEGEELRGLGVHEGGVHCCVFDRTGRLISGGQDGMIRVWDPEQGVELMTLAGHEGAVLGLALTGERLFSAGADGTLRAWDLRRGRARGLLRGHEGAVFGCAVTEEGLLLSAGGDGWLRLWDWEATRCLASNWGESGLRCVTTQAGRALVGDSGGDWWMVGV